jgi:hypothetical protein
LCWIGTDRLPNCSVEDNSRKLRWHRSRPCGEAGTIQAGIPACASFSFPLVVGLQVLAAAGSAGPRRSETSSPPSWISFMPPERLVSEGNPHLIAKNKPSY